MRIAAGRTETDNRLKSAIPLRDSLVRFDWAIKYLLRNKKNFDVLEGFLSELLRQDITIDSILDSESNQAYPNDKHNRVDLLVKTQENEKIIIEVQCSRQYDYLNRIIYGTSKVITESIHKGEPYSEINKIISISILYFNLGEGEDYIYRGKTQFKGIGNRLAGSVVSPKRVLVRRRPRRERRRGRGAGRNPRVSATGSGMARRFDAPR